MINVYISLLVTVFSFSFFFITFRLNGINRTLLNTPLGIFEASIPIVQDADKPTMYFDKNSLESKLTSYYEENMSKYVDEFTINYLYLNESDYSICLGNICDAIQITFETNIVFDISYSRVMRYSIRSNI